MSDVFIDAGYQLSHAGEHAPAQSLVREIAEEAFHHVQPRCQGRREVHVEPRVLGQPLLHRRVLVGGVVVGNQVQRPVLGRLAIDLARRNFNHAACVWCCWH